MVGLLILFAATRESRMLSRQCFLALFLIITVGLGQPVVAQKKSWSKFASFKRVEANPNKEYSLTQANGPWLIMAASFAGPTSEKDASSLVHELRRRFKLPAYTHRQHYDFTGEVKGRGVDKYGKPKKMKYRQDSEFDEIAVMVGDFPSVDDPSLQSTLKAIKYSQPTVLQLNKKGDNTSQRFAGLRAFQKKITGDPEKRRKGPMGQAFVTRNPLLPQEYFTPTGFDSLVESMNSGVKYSLLECPSKFSVQVATFRGNVIIDPKEVAAIERSGKMTSKLMKAAERAHRLTEMLRERGVEAYEFHDRHESIVTVGSFSTVGAKRQDGRIEIEPRIHKVLQSYAAREKPLPGGGKSGMMPRTLGGIMFDIQPKPIQVPRRSIATDYARRGGSVRK